MLAEIVLMLKSVLFERDLNELSMSFELRVKRSFYLVGT